MINVKDSKVQEVLEIIHEAIIRKEKRGGRLNEEILTEGKIFSVICKDFDMGPRKIADCMEESYGYDITVDEVIKILRGVKMGIPGERKEIFKWADRVATSFSKAILGDKKAFEEFDKIRKEPAVNGEKRRVQERLANIMIYEKYPEIDVFEDMERLLSLGNTLARYLFFDIADAICEVYDFPLYKDKEKDKQDHQGKKKIEKTEKQLSHEQALKKVVQLENTLERTDAMLQDLQKEFDVQLEESKSKELAEFFAKLNSEKYGCILDELLVVNKGVDRLRKSNYELPIEINGLLIMVKKLIQFVRDSHIEPIMKVNSVREVVASDIEYCNYDGSPFESPEEKKKIKVISSGWLYKDKDLQISRPKVKEEK